MMTLLELALRPVAIAWDYAERNVWLSLAIFAVAGLAAAWLRAPMVALMFAMFGGVLLMRADALFAAKRAAAA
jgi:hypothetical protein